MPLGFDPRLTHPTLLRLAALLARARQEGRLPPVDGLPPGEGLAALLDHARRHGWERQEAEGEMDDTRPLTGMARLLQEARHAQAQKPPE